MTIKLHTALLSTSLDALVLATYGRPYCLQQQGGRTEEGVTTREFFLDDPPTDFDRATLAPIDDDDDDVEMGVSFAAWTTADPGADDAASRASWEAYYARQRPGETAGPETPRWHREAYWEQRFYPDLDAVIRDLIQRKLLPPRDYLIIVDPNAVDPPEA